VGEVIQVWVGRGGVFGGVVVRAEEILGEIIQVGVGKGRREPGFVPTPPPR
jgi:hypothetical protein